MRFIFLAVLIACAEPSGTSKFATTDQKDEMLAAQGIFLIEEVKASTWQVFYGFADNNGCDNQFDTTYMQQIEAALTKSLQTWLMPLSDKENIVADFNLQQVETVEMTDLPATMQERKLRTFGQSESEATAQLGVIFYCEQGTALAWLPRLPRFYDTDAPPPENNTPIVLHIYQEQTPQEEHAITDLKLYSQAMLLHQTGHAFGLSDAEADTPLPSLMQVSKLANFAVTATDFTLPADDAEGIKWLYDYHIEQSTKLNECQKQYVYDTELKECVAPHPLIYMVIKADLAALQKFMQDNQQLDLNTQYERGNTALHYAAEHFREINRKAKYSDEPIDDAKLTAARGMYDHLLAAGADDSMENIYGVTPAEVLAGEWLSPGVICGTGSFNKPFDTIDMPSCSSIGTGSSNLMLTLLVLLLPLLACWQRQSRR